MSTPARRLEDLRRQRGLVEQQLAALDREIAAEHARLASSAPTAPNPPIAPASRPVVTPAAIPDTDAEAILSRYQHDEKSVTSNVRRGCLLYATGAFVLLIALVLGLYLLLRR